MASRGILEPPVLTPFGQRLTKTLVAIVALSFGVFLFFLSGGLPAGIYNSPDETANFFLIAQMQKETNLRALVRIPGAPNFVAPRSLRRQEETFVPVGFLGFPVLAGLLAKIITLRGLAIFNAVLGAGMILAWAGFCRRLFGSTVGILSALLLALHPAVIYWSARPFYPHAFYLAAVVFSLYTLMRALRFKHERGRLQREILQEQPTIAQPLLKKHVTSFLSGFLAALAFTLRPPEAVWLGVVFLVVLFRKTLRRKISVALLILGGALPLFMLLLLQYFMYGNPLRTGYPLTPADTTIMGVARLAVAPFGLDISRLAQVAGQYLLQFPWWYTLLIGTGIIMCAVRHSSTSRRMRYWALGTLLVALFLLQFYGSLTLHERLDSAPSLGTSFTRYFLPIYLLLTPLAAYGLRLIQFARVGRLLTVGLCLLFGFLTIRAVIWSSDESFLSMRAVLQENLAVRERALTIIPPEAIILTERSDKIFFPYREVVARFRDLRPEQFAELEKYPLYYETILTISEVAQENANFWSKVGLSARDVVPLGGRHTLYKLVSL